MGCIIQLTGKMNLPPAALSNSTITVRRNSICSNNFHSVTTCGGLNPSNQFLIISHHNSAQDHTEDLIPNGYWGNGLNDGHRFEFYVLAPLFKEVEQGNILLKNTAGYHCRTFPTGNKRMPGEINFSQVNVCNIEGQMGKLEQAFLVNDQQKIQLMLSR